MTAISDALIIKIAADTAQLRNEMSNLRSQMGGTFDDINRSASSLKTTLMGLFAGIGVGAAVKEFVETADAMSLMDARLKMTTGSSENFNTAQKEIYRIAQANNIGLQETSALFTKMNEPVKRLGGGVKETAAIVESFSASMRLGGVSSQEAAAATLQFAQAMGSGKLQGDEFRSLAEASPRFMKALADGMGEPIEKLKQMGTDGKLTADVVGNALIKSLSGLKAEAANMPDTVGGAFQRIKNDVMVAVDDLNKNSGLTLGIAGLLSGVNELVPTIKNELGDAFKNVGDWIGRNKEGIGGIWDAVKNVGADIWELGKGFGNALGFVVELGVKSKAFEYSLNTIRFIIAGISDGIDILGASFAIAGAQILKVMGVFSDAAKDAAQSAQDYGVGVFERFAAGDTAVQRLTNDLLKNRDAATDAGKAYELPATVMNQLALAASGATGGLKTLKNAHKELTKEQKEAQEQYKKLIDSIDEKTSEELLESQGLAKLTDGQKQALKIMESIRNKTLELTDAEKKILATKLENRLAGEKENDQHAEELKYLKEAKVERDKATEALNKHAETLEQAAQKQRDENLVMSGTVKSLDSLELGRLKEQRAALQQIVTREELLGYCDKETDAHRRTLDALNDLIAARDEGGALKAAKETAEEWQKTADSINNSLADALMRGFESGKSFMHNLLDTTKNAFKSLVLQPTIKAILSPVSGAIGSLLGGPANAAGIGNLLGSAGNGLSGLLSGATSLTDLLSGGFNQFSAGITSKVGALGDWFAGNGMEGIGGFLNGNALGIGNFGGLLGGAGAGIGIGSLIAGNKSVLGMNGTTTSAVGSALGALLTAGNPLGALVGGALGGVVNKAFGHGPKVIDGTTLEGYAQGGFVGAKNYVDWHQSGGWFSSGKGDHSPEGLTQEAQAALNTSAMAVYNSVKGLAENLQLPVDKIWTLTSDIKVKLTGKADEDTAAINAELAKYGDTLANAYADQVAQFQQTGETIYQTMQRLASVQLSREVLNQFGGVFSRLAEAGPNAVQAMLDLAGGLDALAAKAQSFVQDFYSDKEQGGMAAKNIIDQLKGLGIDAGGISTKDQYRALVESIDVGTATGREQLNALLTLGPSFSNIAQLLTDNSLNLQQLASFAPLIATLSPLFAAQTDATAQSTSAIDATTAAVTGVAAAVQAGADATVSAINNLSGAIQAAVNSAAASSASVSAALSQKLDALAADRALDAAKPY